MDKEEIKNIINSLPDKTIPTVIFKPKQRLIKQNNNKTDNGPERTIHQNGYATQGHNLQSLLYLCRKRLY